MDEKITELLGKLKGNEGAIKEFMDDPQAALKSHGIDMDADQIKSAVEEAKGKLDLGDLEKKAGDFLGGLLKK